MKELVFKHTGKMLMADEGPWRFVLRRHETRADWWRAEIYERQGRRTPKWDGVFSSKAQAIDWLARYRVKEDAK